MEILGEIFAHYSSNKDRVAAIAGHLDTVIQACMKAPSGANLENSDSFTTAPADRQISTIRTRTTDEYGEDSNIVIEIFSEGRARVSGNRYIAETDKSQHSEERTIYFSSEECDAKVASRVLCAIVDMQENHVSSSFSEFVREHSRSITQGADLDQSR